MPAFASGAAVLLALVVVGWVVRVVGVALTERRHPRVAAAIGRYWVVLPVAGLVGIVTWAIGPIGLLLGLFAVAVVASRPDVFGLPER